MTYIVLKAPLNSNQPTNHHLCRVAGNTMWSDMACEFPVAVKS